MIKCRRNELESIELISLKIYLRMMLDRHAINLVYLAAL